METSMWKTIYAHLTMFMFAIVIIGLVLMLSPAVALAQDNDQAVSGHRIPEITEPYDGSSNQQDEIFNRLDEISKRLDEMAKRQDEFSHVQNDISAELKVQANEQKNLSYRLGNTNTLVIILISLVGLCITILIFMFTQLSNRINVIEVNVNSKINTFETKIENRINTFETKIENRINALDSSIGNRINALDAKFDSKIDAQTQIISKMQADIARLDLAIMAIFQTIKIKYNVIHAEENSASEETINLSLPSATNRTEQLPSPATELPQPAASPDDPSGS